MGYKLQTESGMTPPRYVHETLESAIEEAKRLNNQGGGRVEILEIVGYVEKISVPVTELRQVVNLPAKKKDDLPF